MSLMTTEKRYWRTRLSAYFSAQLQSRPRPSSSKTIQDVSTVTISPLDRGSDTHPSGEPSFLAVLTVISA